MNTSALWKTLLKEPSLTTFIRVSGLSSCSFERLREGCLVMALSTELPELMPRKSPRALHAPSLPFLWTLTVISHVRVAAKPARLTSFPAFVMSFPVGVWEMRYWSRRVAFWHTITELGRKSALMMDLEMLWAVQLLVFFTSSPPPPSNLVTLRIIHLENVPVEIETPRRRPSSLGSAWFLVN